MNTLKFKTNIKCGNCVATVTPALNALSQIKHWEVDINNPDKILTIDTEADLPANTVRDALKAKGFDAVKI